MQVPGTTATIGFIGLGVMGAPMAGHLLEAGHALHLHTRSRPKAQALLTRGAVWADTPAALAPACDVICTMLGFPAEVESVYLGPNGLLAHARPGTVLIDFSTSRPDLARQLADEGGQRGLAVLDAPVSGGDVGARDATLSIMVGGEREVFERVRPLLALLGRNIVYQGPAGSGQHCKLCNQITIASTMIGVCEALAYAKGAGLDPHTVLQSISSGAAGSWALTHLAPRILNGNFAPGFFIKHFLKDMGIASEAAREVGLDLPGLELALTLYGQVAAQGEEQAGTQALAKHYGFR